MKVCLLIGIYLLLFNPVFSQSKERKDHSREVIVQTGDTSIRASILTGDFNGKVLPDSRYYWYSKGIINSNINGYSGKLLHGDYYEFLNNKMIEKGQFNFGLKTDKWIKWYQNGNLKETLNYKAGIPDGTYFLYFENGKIQEKGNFKNGKAKNVRKTKIKKEKLSKKSSENSSSRKKVKEKNPKVNSTDSGINSEKNK